MTERAFHPKYVAPFYLDLMNLNFLNKSIEESEHLFNSLKLISNELQDKKLIDMLYDTWRPSKVSAWIIGIAKRENLVDELELILNKKGLLHAEHILLNLLILKGQSISQLLMNFINRQIEYLNETSNKLVVENLSIEWAVSILGYLDKLNSTTNLRKVQTSERWLIFENELKELRFYDAIKLRYESTYYEVKITELMKRIKSG